MRGHKQAYWSLCGGCALDVEVDVLHRLWRPCLAVGRGGEGRLDAQDHLGRGLHVAVHGVALLQLPAAALYAIFALVHAVLAMLVTFLRHTPEATRQFYVYVRTSLIEYHEARLPGGQERVRGRREARKALLSHDEEEEA